VIAFAAVITQAGIGVTGSIVRVTGSGLGCPTWPQCVPGSMVPVAHSEYHALNQWIEFGNRMLTGVVIVVAALCVLIAYRIRLEQPGRRRLVALAWAMPGGVVLQAVVGGMTVLAKLEWWTVAIHFLVSTPLVWLAVLLLHAFDEGDEPARSLITESGRKLLIALVCVMWAVLIAGTTVTGAGPHGGAPETQRLNVPIAVLAQVHAGLLVLYLLTLAAVGFKVLRANPPARFRKRYVIAWVVALAQGALGSVQYALGVPETLVSFHVLGSALVIISVAALWCSARDHGAVPERVKVEQEIEMSGAVN
jgi:cytochrome c oxidase assembly protein subunit 15